MNLVLVLYLILTYLVLKGADTGKLQNGTQEIAIHPDHKTIEFIWKRRVSIELSLLLKIIWEQEVNSKNSEKKSFLQKLIYLANAFQNAIQILLLDKLAEYYCLKYSGYIISGIYHELEKISSIKLSSSGI